MTNRFVGNLKLADVFEDDPPEADAVSLVEAASRQNAARQIAVEAKRLWHEAQLAGLDDLATLMEEAFYRAYQQAGGPKAMRTV